ncbi:MAG TPA: TolC family protein [Terriglobia bacterium]|nr:TolC family protein [Terriglobia bacterium]
MMKLQPHFCPMWLAFLYAVSVFAQPGSPPLTVDDCVRLAQAAQSSVTVARQQAEIARYGITAARAGFLPQSAVNTAFTYNSPLPRNREEFSFVSANGVREYVGLGAVNLDVDTSGRLRAQLARARADADVAAANILLSQRDLKRAVTAAFYRLLLARHMVQVTEDSLKEAQAFEDRANKLFQGQEVARADVVKAHAETQFLQQSLNAAQLEARMANHDLASFWTVDVEGELSLADPLEQPPPTPEPTTPPTARPFVNRFEFRLYDAQRRGFLADARRARADRLPQLSFLYEYGLDSNRVAWSDRGYAFSANLRIPVFDWFRARSAQRQFQLQANQIQTQSNIAERTFSRDYRDALARVELIYGQIAITQEQVAASQENLRLARVRYEGGEGTALDVVAAQSQVTQARTNFYTAKANYLNARAELEVTAGR